MLPQLSMKHLNQQGLSPILIIIALAAIVAMVSLNRPLNFSANISATPTPASSPTPAPTPSPTATPSPTPSPIPLPTIKPTHVPTPALVVNNTPPGAGFSRQTVSTAGQNFPVDIIAADLNSTKVVVDTASAADCSNNCPVIPLGDYIARNGAYAGINGSFFCPAEYPSCAGKTGSFDTLLMNKNKYYFNSSNNVYSTIPAAIFYPGGARFVGQSSQWGRDTSVDAVIANYPLLVTGGNIVYSEAPNEPNLAKRDPGVL